MDCAICLDRLQTPCGITIPCIHHFCFNCIYECLLKIPTCPVCRTQITDLTHDPEFDQLLNPNAIQTNKDEEDNTIMLHFGREKCIPAGITVANNTKGPGVKVIKTEQKGLAYRSGIRKRDVIIKINGIPCLNHKNVIDIVEKSMYAGGSLRCLLLKNHEYV